MNTTLTPARSMMPIEEADPRTDGRAFRRCLGQFATGVTLVTARNGETLVGMAVNSFSAVSLDPPLVLWSIRRESKSAADFLEATHFAVNILASDQVDVSQRFGSGHPERFALTAWHTSLSGAPLIDGAIAQMVCKRVTVHDGGDHWILMGHVEHCARFEGEPLLFTQGQYAVTQNHPNLGSPMRSAAERQSEPDSASFMRLLSTAQQHLSTLFQAHRQALGLTPSTTRILNCLYEGSVDRAGIEQSTYLGKHAIEDALADLLAQGCIAHAAQAGFVLTPKGLVQRQAVADRSAEFAQEKLQDIAAADIAAATRVLQILRRR